MENCPPPSILYLKDFITYCFCNKIPYLSPLLYKDEVFLTLKCECSNKKEFKLSEYLEENKKYCNDMEKCNICKKEKTNYYCIECKKFLCNDCKINHNIHSNDIIIISNLNSICFEHKKKFIWFCKQCKKNICNNCDHNDHNVLPIQKFPEEYILKLKKTIEERQQLLNKFKNIIDELNHKLNELYNLYNIQLQFLNGLYEIYDYFTQTYQCNFHMQQNLFKFYEVVYDRYPKINLILKETKKLIELLDKPYKIISNIKTKEKIKHIELLNNGKLAYCCENDRILHIFQKNDFKIKEFHTKKNINYFTELKNKNILILYYDKSMEIISIENEVYEIIQTFQSDLLLIQNIIELNYVLLFFTSNNEIQIWGKDNEKYDYIDSISFKENIFSHKFDVFKINEKKFVISNENKGDLTFYNGNCNIIGKIHNINIWIGNNMCMLNNNILCYGGNSNAGFYLIDINDFKIINIIQGPTLIYSVIKNKYGIVIASVLENNINKINLYKFSNKNLEFLSSWENESKYFIFFLSDFTKGLNASCNVDSSIKIIANF